MNIKAKLQDAVNALNYGSISTPDKKEEETCSYRIKQTKIRKTIVINCRECDSESSLNDIHCRKNIFRILQKEVQADCLVLSRLYERDCWNFDLPAYFFNPLQENKGQLKEME